MKSSCSEPLIRGTAERLARRGFTGSKSGHRSPFLLLLVRGKRRRQLLFYAQFSFERGESRKCLGNGSRQKPGVVNRERRRRRRAHGCSLWTVEILIARQQRKTRILRERARPKPCRWKERQYPRPGEQPAKPHGSPSASLWVAPLCLALRFSWVSEKVEINLNITLPSLSARCRCVCSMTRFGENLGLFFFSPHYIFILKWKPVRKGICCGNVRAGRRSISPCNFLNAEFKFTC